MSEMKVCKSCGEEKELNFFEQMGSANYRDKCKKCRYNEKKINYITTKERNIKVCCDCKVQKSLSLFGVDENGIIKRSCPSCISLKESILKALDTDEILNGMKECSRCFEFRNENEFGDFGEFKRKICIFCTHPHLLTNNKKCNKCLIIKNLDSFYVSDNNKKVSPECKECTIKRSGLKDGFYNLSDEKILLKRENKKEKRRDNYKYRIENDKMFKIRAMVSGNINSYLYKKKIYKNKKSFIKYVEFTVEELKKHIESLFEPWMSWNNHGIYNPETHNENPTWQLDHIIPVSHFNFTSMEDNDFKQCWALSNLRPLDAKINICEGNRRPLIKKD